MSPRLLYLLPGVVLVGACASVLRRFPLKEPLWEDADQRPFAPRPAKYYSPFIWNGVDNQVFRPLAETLKVERPVEAVNVNALDEVPNSSWFVNRLSRGSLTPEQVAQGPCQRAPLLPFKVTQAKLEGSNPGFFVQDARGERYLLKFDDPEQPELATAADVIGARAYHAAGYNVPCAQIVFFSPEDLAVPSASEGGGDPERAVTPELVRGVLARVPKAKSGLYRAHASLYVEGEPIGPWRYEGMREDDPNDVVPHQHRRELRGGRLLAAWLNHYDAREQNTLASFIPVGGEGAGYVRHYMLDFSDSLGDLWGLLDARRSGHAHYIDLAQIGRDLVTLGIVQRPWERAQLGPAGKVLGYFDVERFSPEKWKPGLANPAFDRMTERDGAWMARILARFSDAHVEAMVDSGQFENRVARDELVRILKGRRDAILRRYLQRLSPLAQPTLAVAQGQAQLCLEDLAVTGGVARAEERRYAARASWHEEQQHTIAVLRSGAPAGVCVALPMPSGARADRPAYLVVDVAAEGLPPTRVHLYGLGGAQFRVVGLERPESSDVPRR
jgi:hypothetical protein